MKVTSLCLGLISGILTSGMILPANAQVTPDGTTNTIVNSSGNNFNILNGTEKVIIYFIVLVIFLYPLVVRQHSI